MYALIRVGVRAPEGFAAAFPSPLRLYPFQVWLDFVAIPVAAILVAFCFYPRFANWLTSAPTTSQYIKRVLRALGLMLLCGWGFSAIMWGVIGFQSPFPGTLAPEQFVAFYEGTSGWMFGAILVHALVTLIAAPLVVAMFLIFAASFLSFGWASVVNRCDDRDSRLPVCPVPCGC